MTTSVVNADDEFMKIGEGAGGAGEITAGKWVHVLGDGRVNPSDSLHFLKGSFNSVAWKAFKDNGMDWYPIPANAGGDGWISIGGGDSLLFGVYANGNVYATGMDPYVKDRPELTVNPQWFSLGNQHVATSIGGSTSKDGTSKYYCYIGEHDPNHYYAVAGIYYTVGGRVYCNVNGPDNGFTAKELPGDALLTKVDVKADGYPIGINSKGELYDFNGSTQAWERVVGKHNVYGTPIWHFEDVAVGPNGKIWGIIRDDIHKNKIIWDIGNKAENKNWVFETDARALKIAVDNHNVAWVIGTNNVVYKYTGTASLFGAPSAGGKKSRRYRYESTNGILHCDDKVFGDKCEPNGYKWCVEIPDGHGFMGKIDGEWWGASKQSKIEEEDWTDHDVPCEDRWDIGECIWFKGTINKKDEKERQVTLYRC